MKSVILRNIERLIEPTHSSDRESIEPMTPYKWQRLYDIAVEFNILPYIAEGLRAYEDDFFLQVPDNIKNEILASNTAKDPDSLSRYQLYADRSQGLRHKLSRKSLQAYAQEFIQKITNIEE